MIKIKDFNGFYGQNQVLYDINLDIPEYSIYSFIGPSGCGKTTMLRSINRLNDLISGYNCTGRIEIAENNIYDLKSKEEIEQLRKGIGMVFQQANPLPFSIYNNMALPFKEHYKIPKAKLHEIVTERLKQAAIFEEVKDKLNKSALSLSGGQQQRLCIARALMLSPEILLFDEPCSALDPIATYAIEELLLELKQKYTIIIVTHNMEQASRISDYTAFFYNGVIVEKGETAQIFSMPKEKLTENYITGRQIIEEK